MSSHHLLLLLFIWATDCAVADQRVDWITIAGDGVEARQFKLGDEKLSLKQALVNAGLELDEESRLATGVTVYRDGEDPRRFRPSVDTKVLAKEQVKAFDQIIVTDFRKHPAKIEKREARITRMLDLGSTEIGKEIRALVELRHEYADWKGKADEKAVGSFDTFLSAEVERLRKAGQAEKVLGLLELHRGALRLDGLANGHPVIKRADELIALFGADAARPIEGEQGGERQPTTAPDAKSEGNEKSKLESEGRSQ